MVSDAPIRSARSCMLVMPNPDDDCSRGMPAVVRDRQPQADRAYRRRVHRDASGARMADGVGERFLRDAENLALDAVAEARELFDVDLDRHGRAALCEIGNPLERPCDVLAVADIRT